MIKVVLPSSFNFDQQVMTLVNVHSRGVDSSWLKKSAAVLTKELSDIRPEPGTTFVHLIALGDQETYGMNRNGDGFPKSANTKYHDTFVKHANWFHNHKNKPHRGDQKYGYVKCSAYNPDMKRVELVVGIDEKKDPDSIQKLARGEDIPVSMACKVPYDVCSICGNRAKTAEDYCGHIKNSCTQMTDGGRQIGMINTEPTFFDISKVHRNADRIAFSLRKVAGVSHPIFGVQLAQQYGITEPFGLVKNSQFERRVGLLQKLAKLEKHIEGEIKANPSMQLVADGLNEPVKADLGAVPEDKLKSALAKLASDRVSLPIGDFYRMVLGPRFSEVEADLPSAQACLPSVFSGALKTAEEFMGGVENYEPVDSPLPVLIKSMLSKVGQHASLTSGPVDRKVASATLRKSAGLFVPNKELKRTSEVGRILATEYARYKLAMLEKVEDPIVLKLSVLQDFGN